MSVPFKPFRVFLILCASAVLAACGGGGSDGGGSSRDGSGSLPPSTATSTGLVPAAPALGATLHVDAAALRPLLPGATWTYRGIDNGNVYSNVVSHAAAGDGVVVESGSNPDNGGPLQQSVSYASGSVRTPSTLNLGNGRTVSVDYVELRSPVREGDQYVAFDKRIPDSNIDVDGDGVADEISLAIYTRVVGEDAVDLVSVPKVKAVKVVTTTLLRIRSSKDGTYSAALSGTSTNWYAPGIGIVKYINDTPASNGVGRYVFTETLTNWDGVTQGVGHLPTVAVKSPTGTPITRAFDAVGFDDHALLLATPEVTGSVSLSAIDARGKVTATHSYSNITPDGARVLRVGDAARVIASDREVEMFFFDANGAASGTPPVVLKSGFPYMFGNGKTFVAASDGVRVWVTWVDLARDGTLNFALLIRPFDAAGQPLAPASQLAYVDSNLRIQNISAAGAAGHIVISWEQPTTKNYALIEATASTPSVHSIPKPTAFDYNRIPVASRTGSTLLWSFPVNGGTNGIAGVAFDAAGEPLRSNALGVESEFLPLGYLDNVQYFAASGGDHVDIFARNLGFLYPEDVMRSEHSVVAELSPGLGPLATQGQFRVLARGNFPIGSSMVSLKTTVLVFSADPYVSVTPVWRRP